MTVLFCKNEGLHVITYDSLPVDIGNGTFVIGAIYSFGKETAKELCGDSTMCCTVGLL